MIVRIMGEGQLEVPEDQLGELNRLDREVETAIDGGDESAFESALKSLLSAVRHLGTPVSADELVDSELILPPADATIDEVRELLDDDGLIPG